MRPLRVTLEDYHPPLPPAVAPQEAAQLFEKAKELGLDRHGAKLQLVVREDGKPSVEALAHRGEGLNAFVEAYSLENPSGERREYIEKEPDEHLKGLLPSGAEILTAEDLEQLGG